MLYAVTIVLNRLIRGQLPFPGWAPLMIVILLTGGLIMIMLGIIGEYLWRIYDDIKGKPMYAVDKRALVPKPAERASEDSAASAQSVK
jgi:dolichol-phosphate mannosyltransferase